MTDNPTPEPMGEQTRQRLLAQLDKMVESGRVTDEEAAQLRAAGDDHDQFDRVIRNIRQRHASPKLDAAVQAGEMTAEEATGHLADLGHGSHDAELRAHLRHHRPTDN